MSRHPQTVTVALRRAALLLLIALVAAPFRGQNTRKVLILHTYKADMTANRVSSDAFYEVFERDLRNQIYDEYIDDDTAFEDDDALVQRLRTKYREQKMDLVVSLGNIPLDFVIRHGEDIWPGALKIFTTADIRLLDAKLPADVTGVVGGMDFGRTLDLALRLTPSTRRAYYIEGSGQVEQSWQRLAAEDLKRFGDNIEITYLENLSLPELLERLHRLPDHSVVIYPGIFRDAVGHMYKPERLCPLITTASNAPVYGTLDTDLGCGVVGGALLDVRSLAKETAELGIRVLDSGSVSRFPIERITSQRAMLDWRQIQRWRITRGAIPADTVIRFRPSSFWEQYRGNVLAAVTALAAQLVLIITLITEVSRRKKSDTAVKDLSGRLITSGEEERKRIARELHDDIGQRLSLVSLELDLIERASPIKEVQTRNSIRESLQQLNEVITDVHSLSHQLHSSKLQVLGLVAALKEVCQQLAKQYGTTIQLAAENVPFPLQEDLGLCFYRVAQEALNNSVKHSGSVRVDVKLTACNGTLRMTIEDYGRGFDPSLSTIGLGLATMRERLRLLGGTLRVISKPGVGTELSAQARLGSLLQSQAKSSHFIAKVG